MDIFKAGEKLFPLGKKTYIMGILNVTPDSFSDGGEHFDTESAVEWAMAMEKDGADIIDIGAQSTRPGADRITAEEELSRLLPVLEALKGKLSVPVSVDTFFPECAEAAIKNGAVIINDVSGDFNESIAALCAEAGAGYIVTHAPCTADGEAVYPDGVIADIRKFFISCIEKAYKAGLPAEQLCLDPGIGFGKSRKDDLEILRNAEWLKVSPYALLCGVSRKRVTDVMSLPAAERDFSTAAADTALISGGADILRVHNVPAAVQTAAMADAIYR